MSFVRPAPTLLLLEPYPTQLKLRRYPEGSSRDFPWFFEFRPQSGLPHETLRWTHPDRYRPCPTAASPVSYFLPQTPATSEPFTDSVVSTVSTCQSLLPLGPLLTVRSGPFSYKQGFLHSGGPDSESRTHSPQTSPAAFPRTEDP